MHPTVRRASSKHVSANGKIRHPILTLPRRTLKIQTPKSRRALKLLRRNHQSSQSRSSQTHCLGPKPSHRLGHFTSNLSYDRSVKATLDQLTSLDIPLTQEAAQRRISDPRMARDRQQTAGGATVYTSSAIQTRRPNSKAYSDVRPSKHRTLRLVTTSQLEGSRARERD